MFKPVESAVVVFYSHAYKLCTLILCAILAGQFFIVLRLICGLIRK